MSITTHILDLARGKPAADVAIRLIGPDGKVHAGATDADGRCRDLLAPGQVTAGTWRLEFDIGTYQQRHGVEPFYPRAMVELEVRDPAQHFHIPLLLSPFGYSTYRGS
ncbi:MAG: hydroxyisourate hydrolase [Myxococcales bacterium]|nr:hydroxyisourate hydrolase [Myxococcales bacterium]